MHPPSALSVYVAFEAFPRPKGAASHIASMVAALAADFGPVLLVCLGYGDMPVWQKEGDVRIVRYKAYHPNLLKRAEGFAQFVAESIAVYAPEAKLCVFRDPWGGVPALHAAHSWATVFEVNALPSWELAYTYPSFANNHALRAKLSDLERFCLQRADRLLSVSSVTAEAIRNHTGNGTMAEVIPNSAHPAFLTTTPSPRKDRIGYFGSLHPWQGIETAIDAFSLLAPAYPHAVLEIVSSSRKDLRKPVRKRARKRGVAERVLLREGQLLDQLVSTVSTWSFTLAPLLDTPRNSVQGCCPVKIIESMAAGVPVIASDLRAVRECIDHGANGILVRPGCARSLASAMQSMLDNEGLRARLAQSGRVSAETRFGRERIHGRLRAFFDEVARERRTNLFERR